MYGLLLANMKDFIVNKHGQKKWDDIKAGLKLESDEFNAFEIFPEGQIIKMGKKSMQVLEMKDEEFYEGMGRYFVVLTQELKYDKFILNLGRNIRDFFLNLDNLHDYLKLQFTRLKPPSFFVQDETDKSMVLQYRSKRRGFHFYVQGQTMEIGKQLFKTAITMKITKQEILFDTVIVTYDLQFDNAAFRRWQEAAAARKEASLPIKAGTLFEMFPFCILFHEDLTVSCIGVALRQVMPGIVGKKVTAYFELIKPLIEFKFDIIQSRSNNMFELATNEEIDKLGDTGSKKSNSGGFDDDINLDEDEDKTLHIKGQMIYIAEWKQMLFLACPIMKDLRSLVWSGLFVNDLSMHDFSRDIMLATSQEYIEMKMALANAELRTEQVNMQMKKLDEVMARTEELLFQMIPKAIAERLKRGETYMETCEVFPSVTMLFSDIVGFTIICSRIKPHEVVMFLNNLYTLFDFLVDQNQVYKVETIGDAYLIVAGCPVKATNHALKICDMAFDMMDGISMLKDPGTGKDVQMRIGCHSGPVVAGIVGLKMPRYCLFGLNVGLTEKFESNSQPMKIHVSEPCKQLLSAQYKCEQRDAPEVREKCGGHMSYFLTTKDGRQPLRPEVIKALLPTAAEMPSVGVKKEEKKADAPKKEEKKADAPKKEEKKEEEKKEEAPKKADAPAPKPAESKKADAPAPKPTAAPAAAKDPAPTAASPTAASGPSAPVEEDPASQETSAPTESAPEEDSSPPAAENENNADESADGGSVKGLEGGPLPVEVVNQQCCTGSKACLIL